MKGILPIWTGRSNKSSSRSRRVSARKNRLVPSVVSLEDRVVLTTATTFFMPSPYASGAFLPVGTVDRVRISFVNQDHPDWVVDPASFTASDITITRNGGSAIDLTNGTPGVYKVGIVGSQTNQNTFWLIGLPRVALATGDYTISVTGSIDFYEAPGDSVAISTETPSGTQNWSQRAGTVAAWGGNISGQSTVPSGLSGVVAVAAGGDFALALKTDGTVTAWGSGTGSTNLPASLTNPATANVVQIAAGGAFALALKADGSIVAWGTNGTYNVVNNAPISSDGNFFAVAAGQATGIAIGDTFATTTVDTTGIEGTLVTWGKNTLFGESLYVEPDTIQGLVQVSGGDDYMVGLRSDSSFFGYGTLPDSPIDTSSYNYVQSVAGGKTSGGSQKFTLLLTNDYSATGWNPSGTAGTVSGWGSNTYGQVNPSTATQPTLTANIPVPFNLNQISRLQAGDLHVVALNSNDNSIKSWGYNGGASPDNRVTGGSAYTTNATVGGISAGATNTLVQVMDLTAPTISTFAAVAPLSTTVFPLKYQITFSEQIDLNTMTTANFQAVNSGGVAQSGFPVSSVTLVSGTTYEIVIGATGNPPTGYNGTVYLQLINGTTVRDIAGNTLATNTSTSADGISLVTDGLTTTAGTLFNNYQWVSPSAITFTLSLSEYVPVAGPTTTSNYGFTTIGSLAGTTVISAVANPDGSAPSGQSKVFTITVATGTPGANASADFQLYLKSGVVTIGGSANPQIDSNSVRVDTKIPTITSVTASTSTGTTPTSTIATGTSSATVYFKIAFADPVSFSGPTGSISNFFTFTTGTYIDPAKTLTPFVVQVFNTASAAYASEWIVQVAAVGQGTLGLTVNPSYTLSGTTYSIVNPVGTAVPAASSSSTTEWTIASNVYTSASIVNGPTGLNPTNTIISPNGLTYNEAQRSQVKLLQYKFIVPVANLATSTAVALTGADFKLQHWVGDNSTGSFQDVVGIDVVLDSVADGSGPYYGTYNLSFSASAVPLWTLPNGYYQVVPSNPTNVKDVNGVVYATGPATYADDFEFYRLFGNANGEIPGEFFPISIDLDDYSQCLFALDNGLSSWTLWSFFNLTPPDPLDPFSYSISLDSYTQVLTYFVNGAYLDGHVFVNT